MKADWLIFFFEIHSAFHCFRVRYEGKHIPLEFIILNCTQNVNCIWLLDSPLWWPEMQNVETRGHAHVRTILPDVSTMSPERGQLRAKKSTKDDWFYLRGKAQREGRRCSVPEHALLSSQPPGLPSLLAALGVQACGLQRHPMLARVPINQILLNGAPSRQLFQTALRNCGWETFKQYILFCHDTCYKWFPGSKQNSWRK